MCLAEFLTQVPSYMKSVGQFEEAIEELESRLRFAQKVLNRTISNGDDDEMIQDAKDYVKDVEAELAETRKALSISQTK